jgi:hypothetical protein
MSADDGRGIVCADSGWTAQAAGRPRTYASPGGRGMQSVKRFISMSIRGVAVVVFSWARYGVLLSFQVEPIE